MQLTCNYHMHTSRCGHAQGTDREFVEKAIECGYKEVGFSDHTPYPFSEKHNPHIRMSVDKLEDYVQSVLSLKHEYRSDIKIHLALEAEYYPRYIDCWKRMVEPYPFDYFILGQHFVGNQFEEVYAGAVTDDPSVLAGYVSQTIEGLETGIYLYLAHPDLLRFSDIHSAYYRNQSRILCESAKKLSIPLEINLLGIGDRRWYPNSEFWKIAGEVGNDVVIGADAHRPSALDNAAEMAVAEKMIRSYNLHLVQTLTF